MPYFWITAIQRELAAASRRALAAGGERGGRACFADFLPSLSGRWVAGKQKSQRSGGGGGGGGGGRADYQRKTTLFCAFPRWLSCALTSRVKCATCETGIAANTAADDHEAGRPGRGEDCFSWCPRRSNPRVSFSLPASCCCCRRRRRYAQFPCLIARVSQEVLATGCLVIPCSVSRHACGRLCGVVI